jgi:hypothetical protein
MGLYVYEVAYTPQSLAAQIKQPQDRIEAATRPVTARLAQPVVLRPAGKLRGDGALSGTKSVEHDRGQLVRDAA